MAATVHRFADHQGVFVLPEGDCTVVFLATMGRAGPRTSHRLAFERIDDARAYAGVLSCHYGCALIGSVLNEDAA